MIFGISLVTVLLLIGVFQFSIKNQTESEEIRILLPTSILLIFLLLISYMMQVNEQMCQQLGLHFLTLFGFSVFSILLRRFCSVYTGIEQKREEQWVFPGILCVLVFFCGLIFFPDGNVWHDYLVAHQVHRWNIRYITYLRVAFFSFLLANDLLIFWRSLCYLWKGIREKDFVERRRGVFYLLILCIPLGTFPFLKLMETNEYWILSVASAWGLFLMSILISFAKTYNTYNQMGLTIFERIEAGILILDQNQHYLTSNRYLKERFPSWNFKKGEAWSFPIAIEDDEFEDSGFWYSIEQISLMNGSLVTGTMYVLNDITEQKEYIQYCERQKKEAELEAESRNRFARQVSHEIRTPMHVVIGLTELTLQKPLREDVRHNLQKIYHFSDYLMKLINSLLDLMRIDGRHIEKRKERYHMASVLHDLSLLTNLLIGEKKIQYELQVDEQVPAEFYGESEMILAVLINLLNNAVKYTREGSIRLRVSSWKLDDSTHLEQNEELLRRRAEKEGKSKEEIREALDSDDLAISFTVEDTGVGIKKEDQERFLAEFQRLEMEEHAGIIGTGVGMSVVLAALEQVAGLFEWTSDYGKGSSFTATFLQRRISEEKIGKFSWEDADDVFEEGEEFKEIGFLCKNTEVLLIDDMEINLEIEKGLFRPYGALVDGAKNYEEAKECLAKKNYDLILMDYMMAGMNGVEMLEKIRMLENGKESVAIAVSADVTRGRRSYFLEHGFREFLAKPISRKEIEKLLKTYLPKEKRVEREEALAIPEERQRLLHIYREEVKQILLDIPGLVRQGAWETLRVKIHGIKGASREVSFYELADSAQELENLLRDHPSNERKKDVVSFMEEVQQLLLFLEQQEHLEERMQVEKDEVALEKSWVDWLCKYLQEYDYDKSMEILEERLRISRGKTEDFLAGLYQDLSMLEYERCIERLQKFLENRERNGE